MDLDPPFIPGGGDVVEVLANPGVAPVRLSADGENRKELDLRIADGDRGVGIALVDRVREAAHGRLRLAWHLLGLRGLLRGRCALAA
jgi:hypothetical protein